MERLRNETKMLKNAQPQLAGEEGVRRVQAALDRQIRIAIYFVPSRSNEDAKATAREIWQKAAGLMKEIPEGEIGILTEKKKGEENGELVLQSKLRHLSKVEKTFERQLTGYKIWYWN